MIPNSMGHPVVTLRLQDDSVAQVPSGEELPNETALAQTLFLDASSMYGNQAAVFARTTYKDLIECIALVDAKSPEEARHFGRVANAVLVAREQKHSPRDGAWVQAVLNVLVAKRRCFGEKIVVLDRLPVVSEHNTAANPVRCGALLK